MEADHELVRESNSGSWAVLLVKNDGIGVPASIAAEGTFKCLTCGGYVVDDLICGECHSSVALLRSGPHQQALADLLNMIVAKPGFLRALEHMTDEALATYFLKKLQRPGD